MKQLVIVGVASFAAGVGGGAWLGIRSPVTHMPATLADSVAVADSAAPADPSPASIPERGPAAGGREASSPAPAAPNTSPASLTAAEATTEAGAAADARLVAKVLGAMKPRDAADILARLTDAEVERILRQLGTRQMAPMLAALPDDRAAALSRRLLGGGPPDAKGDAR